MLTLARTVNGRIKRKTKTMDFNFTLFQVSISDWKGMAFFAFETDSTYMPLLHFEVLEDGIQFILFFFLPIYFKTK